MKVYNEHGWLTIRTDKGWLLYEAKIDKIPSSGIDVEEIEKVVKRNLASDPHKETA